MTVSVSPNDGSCAPWKAASNADWITVSPASGTTSTTVRVDYAQNTAAGARTGGVSFMRPDCNAADCGFTVALNQSGRPGSTPPAGQGSVSTKCGGPVHPGEYAGLVCVVTVQEKANNPVQGVYADRSLFGGRAQVGVPKCPACGGPPWTFDLDLPIPGNMAPGVKTFAVWAIYAYGSRVDTTTSIEIAGPPSQLTISTKCFGPVHP